MTTKSKCCGAGSEKSIGYTLEESPLAGTWDYLCSKCGRPCDVVALPPVTPPTVEGKGYCPAHGYPVPCNKCGYDNKPCSVEQGKVGVDCEGTRYPTCPFCGYVDSDYYDVTESGNSRSCGSCGADYFCTANIHTTFTSEVIK